MVMHRQIKNEIYFHKILKIIILYIVIVVVLFILLEITVLYRVFHAVNENGLMTVFLFAVLFVALSIFSVLIGLLPHRGPSFLSVNNNGITIYTKNKRNKREISWEEIYAIREMDIHSHEPQRTVEYRVFYYDKNGRIKCFVVSKEIGEKIKEELKKKTQKP